MEPDDLNVFHASIGFFPVGEILNVFFGLPHAGNGKHLVELALGKHAPGVEVADAVKNDPDVGARVVDVVRGRGGEAEEQAELDDDEDQGKHNSGQGDGETDTVVKEVATSK